MAKLIHLEGTDFSINLDFVESFRKGENSGKPAILFRVSADRENAWTFDSEETRNTIFKSLNNVERAEIFRNEPPRTSNSKENSKYF